MDQHFHYDIDPPTGSSTSPFVANRGERIGVWAVGIVTIGLALFVALVLVAVGIAAVRWAA